MMPPPFVHQIIHKLRSIVATFTHREATHPCRTLSMHTDRHHQACSNPPCINCSLPVHAQNVIHGLSASPLGFRPSCLACRLTCPSVCPSVRPGLSQFGWGRQTFGSHSFCCPAGNVRCMGPAPTQTFSGHAMSRLHQCFLELPSGTQFI